MATHSNERKAMEATATGTTRRTLWRSLPNNRYIVVNIEVRDGDPSGLSDGFSVTGELYEPHGTWSGAAQFRNGRESDMGGCIHEEVLEAFVGLKPIVDLHLSDLDGAPMHAEANGWYFYSDYDGKGANVPDPYDVACRHLRVDAIPSGLTREEFGAFVDEQRPRWKTEADHARALIESIPTVQELRGYDTFGQSIGNNPPVPAWVHGN
jgi:hypothetical protein